MSKKLVLIDELLRHLKIKGFSLNDMETILKVKRQEEIKQLTLTDVGNWVAIESNEQPEKCTEVVVIYKDGRKAVALFDGDGRFYIEKDDWDITNMIEKWHRLP